MNLSVRKCVGHSCKKMLHGVVRITHMGPNIQLIKYGIASCKDEKSVV